jgi:flavin reductase (DIM6/NTAB) family NADH-FMN oxidoreductase RutF
MSKISWKGGALLAPVPAVMVSCGSMEAPNIVTVAWTGITCTQPPKTYISLRKSRHSYGLIKESGCFVINLTTENLVRATDFCGVRSGRDMNKFEICHLTPEASEHIPCPAIAESPLSIECKVTDIIELGSHDMFLADIVGVRVDESLMDANGRLALEKAGLAAYCHGEYFALGKKLGKFGYSVEKKKKKHKPQSTKAK